MNTKPILFEGNLALQLETRNENGFSVIDGGRCISSNRAGHRSSAKIYMAIALLTISLASVIIFSFAGQSFSHKQTLASTPHISITVHRGDSLWSIANRCKVANLSTQEISDEIVSLNQLTSTTLTPGQVLTVPSK